MEAIRIDQYTMVKLEEHPKYGISLQEGREGQDGVFKPNFCKKSFGKRGEEVEKNVPVNIKLGAKEKAVEVLKALLFELQGENEYINKGGIRQEVKNPVDDSAVPF